MCIFGFVQAIIQSMVLKWVYFSFQCTSSTWGNFNMTKCFYLLQKADFAGALYMGDVTSYSQFGLSPLCKNYLVVEKVH
jgi:hypothetical protein